MSEAHWTQAKKLASLHPELRPLVERLVGRMTLRGFKPKIFFGARGLKTQDRLQSRGTTKLSVSFHNHREDCEDCDVNASLVCDECNGRGWVWASLAADIVDADVGWANPAFFVAFGEEAEDLGLYWGGRWADPDEAHVQLWPNDRLDEVRA